MGGYSKGLERTVRVLVGRKSKEVLIKIQKLVLASSLHAARHFKIIDPMQKWLPLIYSFVPIQNSPTNLVFETKILKNLLSRTRFVGLF